MRRVLIAVSGVMLLSGCASGFDRPVKEVTAKIGDDHIQHIQITAHSFYFEPNRLVVKRGMPVDLTVKNGAMFVPHAFLCMAKDAGLEVDQGVGMFHGSKHVTFTATKTGEYSFHCPVDGHAKKGMTGTLVVVEP